MTIDHARIGHEHQAIQAAVDAMTAAFAAHDVDGIMAAYEPAAVVVGEPGRPVAGDAALRALFAGFIAVDPRFTFFAHEIVQAGDLAVHLNTWRLDGRAPDGTPVEQHGLSVAVLRRQPDGRWLLVIDHPFGDAILAARG
jgi:uncharacterized protein (TIGR02246 family)